MVNVHIRCRCPRRTVVVRVPRARRRGAVARRHHVRSIALQHVFARIAGAADGVPGLEVVPLIRRAVRLRLDGDVVQI